ncbi:uncharacterized protein LOC116150976 [Camelus dromedarius]|uniref:uncharacterized protein LOC116150976 n=1 Tax=Camelus dromedarius TaxID=9838 RepID=UPI0031191D03
MSPPISSLSSLHSSGSSLWAAVRAQLQTSWKLLEERNSVSLLAAPERPAQSQTREDGKMPSQRRSAQLPPAVLLWNSASRLFALKCRYKNEERAGQSHALKRHGICSEISASSLPKTTNQWRVLSQQREMLLWERSLVFSLPASSNHFFLPLIFGLVVSFGSTPTKRGTQFSDTEKQTPLGGTKPVPCQKTRTGKNVSRICPTLLASVEV